jgi:hypothetical protein
LLPTDWIYHHIFHFSEDQFDEYRDLILQDAKRKFRLAQVTEEGNDPLETGKSYGTPHDLASLYGKGRMYDQPDNVPVGYGSDLELGRPKENPTDRNTQDDNFGKDRLGAKGMKNDDNESNSINPKPKGGSPLSLEAKQVYLKNRTLIESLGKRITAEISTLGDSLLDESKLKE